MDTQSPPAGQDVAEATSRLWTLIADMEVAMMTTEDAGILRSRPMAAVDRDSAGALWFFTRASSHKVAELGGDERVNLSYADPIRDTYVSMSGKASLVRDADEIVRRWDDRLLTWFPNGRDDPDTALLRVRVERGEYWDAAAFAMRHLHDAVTEALGVDPAGGVAHAQLDLREPGHSSTGM
jgi:general stress protein 26